jgi:hypothetical protein
MDRLLSLMIGKGQQALIEASAANQERMRRILHKFDVIETAVRPE